MASMAAAAALRGVAPAALLPPQREGARGQPSLLSLATEAAPPQPWPPRRESSLDQRGPSRAGYGADSRYGGFSDPPSVQSRAASVTQALLMEAACVLQETAGHLQVPPEAEACCVGEPFCAAASDSDRQRYSVSSSWSDPAAAGAAPPSRRPAPREREPLRLLGQMPAGGAFAGAALPSRAPTERREPPELWAARGPARPAQQGDDDVPAEVLLAELDEMAAAASEDDAEDEDGLAPPRPPARAHDPVVAQLARRSEMAVSAMRAELQDMRERSARQREESDALTQRLTAAKDIISERLAESASASEELEAELCARGAAHARLRASVGAARGLLEERRSALETEIWNVSQSQAELVYELRASTSRQACLYEELQSERGCAVSQSSVIFRGLARTVEGSPPASPPGSACTPSTASSQLGRLQEFVRTQADDLEEEAHRERGAWRAVRSSLGQELADLKARSRRAEEAVDELRGELEAELAGPQPCAARGAPPARRAASAGQVACAAGRGRPRGHPALPPLAFPPAAPSRSRVDSTEPTGSLPGSPAAASPRSREDAAGCAAAPPARSPPRSPRGGARPAQAACILPGRTWSDGAATATGGGVSGRAVRLETVGVLGLRGPSTLSQESDLVCRCFVGDVVEFDVSTSAELPDDARGRSLNLMASVGEQFLGTAVLDLSHEPFDGEAELELRLVGGQVEGCGLRVRLSGARRPSAGEAPADADAASQGPLDSEADGADEGLAAASRRSSKASSRRGSALAPEAAEQGSAGSRRGLARAPETAAAAGRGQGSLAGSRGGSARASEAGGAPELAAAAAEAAEEAGEAAAAVEELRRLLRLSEARERLLGEEERQAAQDLEAEEAECEAQARLLKLLEEQRAADGDPDEDDPSAATALLELLQEELTAEQQELSAQEAAALERRGRAREEQREIDEIHAEIAETSEANDWLMSELDALPQPSCLWGRRRPPVPASLRARHAAARQGG